jgi:hypothetical protein
LLVPPIALVVPVPCATRSPWRPCAHPSSIAPARRRTIGSMAHAGGRDRPCFWRLAGPASDRACAPCLRVSTGMRRFDNPPTTGCPSHEMRMPRGAAPRDRIDTQSSSAGEQSAGCCTLLTPERRRILRGTRLVGTARGLGLQSPQRALSAAVSSLTWDADGTLGGSSLSVAVIARRSEPRVSANGHDACAPSPAGSRGNG